MFKEAKKQSRLMAEQEAWSNAFKKATDEAVLKGVIDSTRPPVDVNASQAAVDSSVSSDEASASETSSSMETDLAAYFSQGDSDSDTGLPRKATSPGTDYSDLKGLTNGGA